MRCQDTTDVRPVSFPFWMVQQIALDLEEKSRLEKKEGLLLLELSKYEQLTAGLQQTAKNRDQQLQLLQKEHRLLQAQLAIAKIPRKRESVFSRILELIGAIGAGYLLGRL